MKMKGRKIAAKCPSCGEMDFFVCGTETGVHICSKCGFYSRTENYKRRAYANCECGSQTKYLTNEMGQLFDAKCWACEAPVTVEWNPKKHIYQTVRG